MSDIGMLSGGPGCLGSIPLLPKAVEPVAVSEALPGVR
jgi:hypothetical protein